MASLKYYNKTTKQWEYVSSDSSDIVTDSTLTQAGQAADAKVVGDLLAEKQPKGNYLTEIPDTYATEEFVKNKIAEAELGGEEVDLSGYAQKSELPTKVSQLQNDAGYLTEHQDISGKLNVSELPTAINTALAQAKASGEFDGADGQPGKDGVDGKDGADGVTPHVGSNGNWFVGGTDTGVPATGPSGGQGLPGTPGEDGKDGTSATHSWNGTVLTITSASGTSSADLKGAKGDTGAKGEQGESGVWVGSEAPVDDSYSVWIDPTGENSGGNVDLTGVVKSVNGQTPDENGNVEIMVSGGTAVTIDYDQNVHSVNHRGYSASAPENTIPAYILSKQMGFTYAEADVSFTSDGVAVLLHDATIDRTSNGSGNISAMTYAEASKYDYGSWKNTKYTGTRIPTFEEFIILCKRIGLHPYIELKQNGSYTEAQIQALVEMVKNCGMKEKSTWISFSDTFLGYVKSADSTARLGYLNSNDVSEGLISKVQSLKTDENEVYIGIKYTSITDDGVRLCADAGIPLEVWTVNSESDILALNPYITGITSDSLIGGKVLYDAGMVYKYDNGENDDIGGNENLLYNWDLTSSLTDTVSGVTATLAGDCTQDENGLTIVGAGGSCHFSSDIFSSGRTVEIDVASADFKNTSGTNCYLVAIETSDGVNGSSSNGLIYRNTGSWQVYTTAGWATPLVTLSDANVIAGKTIKLVSTGYNTFDVFIDGILLSSCVTSGSHPKRLQIGSTSTKAFYDVVITAVRVYETDGSNSDDDTTYAEPLVNIDMSSNGVNIGTGGADYNAVNTNGSFVDGKFVIDNDVGYLSIPTGFMAISPESPWTLAFTVDSYEIGNQQYARIARGMNDVPSVYYNKNYNAFQTKLASGALAQSLANYVDDEFMGLNYNNGYVFQLSAPVTLAFRNDGNDISFWVNGEKKAQQQSSDYVSKYLAPTFSIGDDASAENSDMKHMECSMLKLWDVALTDEQMATF